MCPLVCVLHRFWNQMSTNPVEDISLVGLWSGNRKQSTENLWVNAITFLKVSSAHFSGWIDNRNLALRCIVGCPWEATVAGNLKGEQYSSQWDTSNLYGSAVFAIKLTSTDSQKKYTSFQISPFLIFYLFYRNITGSRRFFYSVSLQLETDSNLMCRHKLPPAVWGISYVSRHIRLCVNISNCRWHLLALLSKDGSCTV